MTTNLYSREVGNRLALIHRNMKAFHSWHQNCTHSCTKTCIAILEYRIWQYQSKMNQPHRKFNLALLNYRAVVFRLIQHILEAFLTVSLHSPRSPQKLYHLVIQHGSWLLLPLVYFCILKNDDVMWKHSIEILRPHACSRALLTSLATVKGCILSKLMHTIKLILAPSCPLIMVQAVKETHISDRLAIHIHTIP